MMLGLYGSGLCRLPLCIRLIQIVTRIAVVSTKNIWIQFLLEWLGIRVAHRRLVWFVLVCDQGIACMMGPWGVRLFRVNVTQSQVFC